MLHAVISQSWVLAMFRKWKMKRVWPSTAKIEETRSFQMEEQARIDLAAYCEQFGRVRTLELLDELRQEVLAKPLRPR